MTINRNNNFYLNPFVRLFLSVLRAPITPESTALLRFILTSADSASAPATVTTSTDSDSKQPRSSVGGCRLLDRMIEHFMSVVPPPPPPPTTTTTTAKATGGGAIRCRTALTGFVIDLCNHVRLTAAVQSAAAAVAGTTAIASASGGSSEWLPEYLSLSSAWKQFLPLLL